MVTAANHVANANAMMRFTLPSHIDIVRASLGLLGAVSTTAVVTLGSVGRNQRKMSCKSVLT